MATKDYWPGVDDHLNKLQLSWDKYLGKKFPHKIDKDTEAYQKVYIKYDHHFIILLTLFQAKAKLCDLRNRMKNRSDQVTLDEFRRWVGDNAEAMKDQDKRIAFGKEYCTPREWKFSWKVFDKEVSTQSSFETIVNDVFDREEYGQKNSRAP